ncbi:hypothetical protein FG379_001699 [Cryptosporidium bovis]|uniref:uncharacterized protein n=1 Tax=Cryptosporidium bovis TaxID=310047 RepID=UPI003519E40C|nr:hypothetical protein FG379_001699 [Cryptosporidium bovis]
MGFIWRLLIYFLLTIQLLNFQTVYGFYSAVASPSASTTITAYSIGSSTVTIYYMLTQARRGPLGKILAGIFLPIQKNREGDYYFDIETDYWDGDTLMVASSLLYYYSLSVNPYLNDRYSIYSSKILPKFPWGEVTLEEDPFDGVKKIYDYIVSLKGGIVRVSLNNVDIWQLYFLAVIKEYSKARKKFSLKEQFAKLRWKKKNKDNSLETIENEKNGNKNTNIDNNNSIRDVKRNIVQDRNVKTINETLFNGQRSTLDVYLQVKKLESSSVITDFVNKKKRCTARLTVVCKNKTNSKVKYLSVPWIPGERSAIDELKVIYEYTKTLDDNSISEICEKNKLNKSLANFSLAFILYLRERQFDSNYIDLINFKIGGFRKLMNKFSKFGSFFFDLFGLSHRKNATILAQWKRIQEEQWKLNPSKTIEFLIMGAHIQELRSDKYSSTEWSEFDFVIGSVVHFFVIILGVPLLYGQYISKVNRRHYLVDRDAQGLQKYNVPNPHSVKYEIE